MKNELQSAPRPASLAPSSSSYAEDRRYVIGVLARRCGWLEPSRLEDLFHDAYLVLLEKLEAGALEADMARPQVRAYLTQTALNKAYEGGRRASRRSLSLDRDDCAELRSPEPEIEDRVILREEARRVDDAVALLPERRRKVLKLRYYLGFEPDQIQRRLGVSRDVYRHELERGTRSVMAAVA